MSDEIKRADAVCNNCGEAIYDDYGQWVHSRTKDRDCGLSAFPVTIREDREQKAMRLVKESGKEIHTNTCATSVAPAEEPGPCDCDAAEGDGGPTQCSACGKDICKRPYCQLGKRGHLWEHADTRSIFCTPDIGFENSDLAYPATHPAAQPIEGDGGPRKCKYGDPTCPCQDGDPCHYEGENPMSPPNLRDKATREEFLWAMDMKTAALKRIHRKCNELLDGDYLDKDAILLVKNIRYISGAHYPAMEPTINDRLTIVAMDNEQPTTPRALPPDGLYMEGANNRNE